MSSKTLVLLALFALVAQCYVLREKEPHSREKRSCYVCENVKDPPLPPKPRFGPPPPPPYFRTQNWNGITRRADGSHQGVFSGASVAANSKAAGRAYSVASSSANAEIGRQGTGGWDGGDVQGRQPSRSNYFESGKSSFENSNSNSASTAQAFGSEFSRNQQRQVQSVEGGFGNSHSGGPEKYQNAESLRGDNKQQVQTSEKGQNDNNFRSSQSTASRAQHVSGAAGNSANADPDQEAFKGALNLASQGLQTAKQTSNTGCSSCNKGSYAFSNAKSDSGNAIAVSIGR